MRELEPCPPGQVITESLLLFACRQLRVLVLVLSVHGSFLLWWALLANMSGYPCVLWEINKLSNR
jgi:hypothetical protein